MINLSRESLCLPRTTRSTHLAVGIPAPICEECDQVMLTVTEVYNRKNGEPLKLVSRRW